MTTSIVTQVSTTPIDAFGLHIAVLQDMGARLNRSLELAHRAIYPEMYQALDEALAAVEPPVIEWDEDDCVEGDTHGRPCAPLERFHSYCEASGEAFALEARCAFLEAAYCPRCDGFHLVAEKPRVAERFLVD